MSSQLTFVWPYNNSMPGYAPMSKRRVSPPTTREPSEPVIGNRREVDHVEQRGQRPLKSVQFDLHRSDRRGEG